MSFTNPSIAFFGATGGCANVCLAYSLQAGYSAAALVRTPSKLKAQLLAQGLSEEIIAQQLTIIQGNARNITDVKRTLTGGTEQGTTLVSTIITALGSSGHLHFDHRHPLQPFEMDDATLCESATQVLFSALRDLYAQTPSRKASKPLLAFISTTGIVRPGAPDDVPFMMRFLYHHILAVPHNDKRQMEKLYHDDMANPEAGERVFRNIIGVRPTLLSGGASMKDSRGLDKTRVGTEQDPAFGYNIRRADVGNWIFENVIKGGGRGWEGEMVTLTS